MKDLLTTRREALAALAGVSALAAAGPALAQGVAPSDATVPANVLGVHVGFTKLIVADLEKSAAFYRAVFGLLETGRVDAAIAGRKLSEVLFAPTAPGGATFVLLAFHDAPKPAGGEVILGAITTDIDAFLARAISAGGSLVEAAHELAELKIKVGFVADVEGHLIEVVQQLA